MTTILAEKNIIVKDADGNIYSIPPRMETHFIAIKEASINASFGSNEWHEANDEMNEQFSEFLK